MKRHALFVGVNDYADRTIQDLHCAVNDATELAGFFKHRARFDRAEALPNPRNCDVVLDHVLDMVDGLGSEDEFLFFFAGHGVKTQDGHRLVCAGDLLADVKHGWAGIPLERLKFKTAGAFNRLFLLDACRTDVLATNRGVAGAMEKGTRDLILAGAASADVGNGALTILCSCDDGECAGESLKLRHGLFSLAMLELLDEECRCGRRVLVTDDFAYNQIPARMRALAEKSDMAFNQRPQKKGPPILLLDGVGGQPVRQPEPVVCPECGSYKIITDTFKCRICGRDHLCKDHFSKEEKCCADCAAKVQARRAADERKREEAKALLEEGKRLERTDPPKAAACFRQAADLGNREACHRYGDMLFNGRGIEKNVDAAFECYRKCDDADAWIQYDLGLCHLYFAQERGKEKEGAKAVACFRTSSDCGVPWARVKLGDCYRDGIGVPRRDFAAAASCYRHALEGPGLKTYGDHGAAQWAEYNLGCLFRDGKGVGKNPAEALKWFRKAAARHSDAADLASTAAAEMLPDVLAERVGDKLGMYWQDFRIIHGVQIRDADGRLVPLAGLVASNRAIFVGVSLESLPAGIRNSLPSDNPAESFAQVISNDCGIPLECFLRALVVSETFCIPNAELPSWAVRESNLADAMLKEKAEVAPDWLGKRQDIIRKLEELPMSSEGAEKNALIHFKADVPEWEDGAALLEKVEMPSTQLIQLARRAAEELDQAGKRSVADNIWTWLEKKGEVKARPAALPKTGDVKTLIQPGGGKGEHKKVQLWKDGPYWAEKNVGAENPWESGYYFWWGDTVGYKWENGVWVASDGSTSGFSFEKTNEKTNLFGKLFGKKDNIPTCGKDCSTLLNKGWITRNDVLAPEHDAAHVQWGRDWRMPTEQELKDLCNKCDWIWTTMNGVDGYVVCGKGEYASASIFLPCAGLGYGTSLSNAGSNGGYWSSVPGSVSSYFAWGLGFYSSYHGTSSGGCRFGGQSVRPVQGFTK